ncbi:structural maintenance of chromosomes protein 1B isoform X2 [Cynoglossus semilaevis]|uniref:structural maintenance of chromosomes protein 1B isoform X2 n=1 Tax=Cynoglossus semilaevis TaxID=244447 RepID=UPI000495830B|nr:structural maintenance of chromosomes protein 1B-like isoform X2 [Cynoglossus semilaevis]
MGFLKQIEVENFKSWRGKQVIGPFLRFNCIIGTNGSGNSSHYRINGITVTYARYVKELEKIGIVTKARNCLVFQGAVESIALKDPKERTKMFEQISQSIEFAADYEKKKEALLKAKEDTQFHFNKKTSATVEKKQMFREQVEAQKYQALVDSLQENRLQLSLAELYYNEKHIHSLIDNLEERQQAAATNNNMARTLEQTVKTHKKEHGRLLREQQQVEKEISAQEHALSQLRSQYIKIKMSISHHTKKVEDAGKSLKNKYKLLSKKEQDIEESQQEIKELERTWKHYEKQAQQQRASYGRDIELEADQLERYKELKVTARMQAAILRQQGEKLHSEVKAGFEKLSFDQRKKKEVEVGIRNTQNQLEDLMRRAEKLEEYNKSCKLSIEEYGQQEKSLMAELQKGKHRSEELNEELGQVLQELRNASLDNQECKRQLQRNELLMRLQRLYPESVYGRLSDLCSPIHNKYLLAVTKVFGHNMSAIVVTTERIARDCISYIKVERSGPETFLPIDYLNVRPLKEQLREVPGAKMLVDVVKINITPGANQLKKVVQFVCGNALVCETIKEAQQVAFGSQERIKTVALDGTLFAKSGVISGGSSHLRTKARCWEEKDVTKLRERKDQITTELRYLMKLKRKESDLKQTIAQAQGSQIRLKYSKIELENIKKKNIVKCQSEISRMESELANLDYEIKIQQESLETKEAEMNMIRDQINQMEDLVFSDFCAEIGVDNIRAYEQEHQEQVTELDKKRLEFQSQRARLSAQLEYEQEQIEQQKKQLNKMENAMNEEKGIVAVQKKDEQKVLLAVEEAQNNLLEVEDQLLHKKTQVTAAKTELDQETQRLHKIQKDSVNLERDVMFAKTSLEQKRLVRHNLLLACKLRSLPVSLLSGILQEISEVQLDTESTLLSTDIHEREAEITIDYSQLKAELKNLEGEAEVKAHLEKLQKLVDSLELVLHQTAVPNMKALEKMVEMKNRLQEINEAFSASSKETKRCSMEFEKVKAQRCNSFVKCFEHVSVVIDQIYKRICRNSSAQAILCADTPDEPYLGGINYNCVAPGKRFMSMDNLSGGEKAIAALALVFAIHSFRPGPFIILDEVDAALDNTNISKVTSFIRKMSQKNLQAIVISLKEEFFSKADALFGVYSDVDKCMFSRILSLDLRPYPLAEEENGEHMGSDH